MPRVLYWERDHAMTRFSWRAGSLAVLVLLSAAGAGVAAPASVVLTAEPADGGVRLETPFVERLQVEGEATPPDRLPATWRIHAGKE